MNFNVVRLCDKAEGMASAVIAGGVASPNELALADAIKYLVEALREQNNIIIPTEEYL